MIQLRSILDVADNTGARRAAMISKMGQITDTAGVGDIVTVHIKESTTDATVKKGEVAKATLTFEHAGAVPVEFAIRGVGASGDGDNKGDMNGAKM